MYHRYKEILIIILAVIFLFLHVCPCPAGELPHFFDEVDDKVLVDSLAAHMTDEELLGQVFFLGYQGIVPSEEINTWISGRNLGGVKVFSRNMEELNPLAKSIFEMQTRAASNRFGIPLFIATDQEGGWVRHIWKDVLEVPGNLALGADRYPGDAYLTGYYIGLELAALGINMNFAPDVDVYSNIQNAAIGPRSFSSDPVKTGFLSCAYFSGMKKAGILCTAKHFPGHGGAEEDSHGMLPQVLVSLDELWNRELVPYRFLIKEGIPAIMTAHIAFPTIVDNKTPATLSPFFLNDLLREKLKFKGIAITDDLEMYGAHDGKIDIPDVTRKAVYAGCDMLLISHRPKRQESAWNPLLELMKTDSQFRGRIKESVKRILRVKTMAFKGKHPSPIYPDHENAASVIKQVQEKESYKAIFQGVCRSVTLIRRGLIPYNPVKGERILLLGQYPEFIEQGLVRFPGADTYEYSYYPAEWATKEEKKAIGNLVREYDTIVFLLVNYNSYEILASIKKYNKKILVVSSLTPVYLKDLPWVKTAIAVYGTTTESYEAAFAVLCGDFEPEGRLPISIE